MESNAKNAAIKSGLIVGLVGVIISMLLYVMDATLMVDWKIQILSFVISLFLFVYFGKKYRNEEQEGFMPFGDAFKFNFVAGIVYSIVVGVFSILLFNVIDTELSEVITEQTLETTESMLETFGTPQSDIDKALEDVEKDLEGKFSTVELLKGSWAWLLSAAVYGLIAGAIIQKSRPEFE